MKQILKVIQKILAGIGILLAAILLFLLYYTSPIDHDYAWILGMFSPSAIRMVRVDLKALEVLADQTPSR